MHISSQKPRVAGSWGQKLYLGMVGLILICIVTEGLLIGPSLFAATHWGRAIHGYLGVLISLLALALPVVSWLVRLSRRTTIWNAVLFVIALIEVIAGALGRRTPFLAALHPANALLMSGLTILLLIQGWQMLREQARTEPF